MYLCYIYILYIYVLYMYISYIYILYIYIIYTYIYILVTTKEFSENKVLNIVKRRAITNKLTLTSARCDTVFHIRR